MLPDTFNDVLLRHDDGGICTLTIDRPDALNAMDGALVAALWSTFRELRHDPGVRVVILTASGSRAFCAGADLRERQGMDERAVRQRIDDYKGCFEAIATLPKPVICAINGVAFGGGLELALACDLRVMSEDTQVGLTELRLGIIPGAGGTQRLSRLVGAARAKELIFTAARIGASRALDLGLVNAAVPAEQLLEHARQWARQMLECAPIALAQAKLAIDTGLEIDLASGLTLEAVAYAVTIPTEDRQEGLAAFREKRAPQFKGR